MLCRGSWVNWDPTSLPCSTTTLRQPPSSTVWPSPSAPTSCLSSVWKHSGTYLMMSVVCPEMLRYLSDDVVSIFCLKMLRYLFNDVLSVIHLETLGYLFNHILSSTWKHSGTYLFTCIPSSILKHFGTSGNYLSCSYVWLFCLCVCVRVCVYLCVHVWLCASVSVC